MQEQYFSGPRTAMGAIADTGLRTGLVLGGMAVVEQIRPEHPVELKLGLGLLGIALAVGGVFKPLISGEIERARANRVMNKGVKEVIVFDNQNTNGGGI